MRDYENPDTARLDFVPLSDFTPAQQRRMRQVMRKNNRCPHCAGDWYPAPDAFHFRHEATCPNPVRPSGANTKPADGGASEAGR